MEKKWRALSLIVFLLLSSCEYFRTLIEPLPDNVGAVKGLVIDAETKEPISKVKVSCRGEQTETNALGYYYLERVVIGKQKLSFEKAGYYPKELPVEVIQKKVTSVAPVFLKSKQKELNHSLSKSDTWETQKALVYIIKGVYLIPKGVTLTIKQGVIIRFQTNNDGEKGKLVVEGTLDARGTPELPVVFTTGEVKRAGAWQGISFKLGSRGYLRHCVIEYGRNGIHSYRAQELTITDCQIRYNNHSDITRIWAGIFVYQSPLLVKNSLVRFNGTGIYCSGYEKFPDSGPYSSRGILIKGNIIENNRQDGIIVRDALVKIKQNTIQANGGNGIWYYILNERYKGVIEENNICYNGQNLETENGERVNQYAVKGNGTPEHYIEVRACYIAYNDGCEWSVGDKYPEFAYRRAETQCEDFIRVYSSTPTPIKIGK